MMTRQNNTAAAMPTIEGVAHRLPVENLRLAIIDVITAPDPEKRTLPSALAQLWREDPEQVTAIYDDLVTTQFEDAWADGSGRHGLRAERMEELRRPLSARKRQGMTLQEVAEQVGLRVETLARLLEHHGYLETSPFGGRQNRRLISAKAYAAKHGHNVDPTHMRSIRLDGAHRTAPFPVFYAEHVPSILWSLGWDLIQRDVAARPTKKARLEFLLVDHAYLPDAEIAALSGYSREGITRARGRAAAAMPVTLAA